MANKVKGVIDQVHAAANLMVRMDELEKDFAEVRDLLLEVRDRLVRLGSQAPLNEERARRRPCPRRTRIDRRLPRSRSGNPPGNAILTNSPPGANW